MFWDCDAVYCGFWNNESNEGSFKTILTLPGYYSYIIAAFFALFVKFSGGHLWGTVIFSIHQINASARSQDDIYHQVQLVLRNTESEASMIGYLLKVIRAHKNSRFEAYRRTLFLILIASIYGISLFFASTLSSTYFIVSGDESVLSKSRNCGWIAEPDFSSASTVVTENMFEAANALAVVGRNMYRRSASYSRSCYSRFGSNATTCKVYVKPTLPYTVHRGIPCPFSGKACNGTAISLDTGFLRSDTDLGINTRPDDALAFRKVLTCVPVAGENYATGWEPIPPQVATEVGLPPGLKYKAYAFGKGYLTLPPSFDKNYTMVIHEASYNFSQLKYDLDWATANVDLPASQLWYPFSPIPDLRNVSADTTLIGLKNKMRFRTSVSDPWFNAENCISHSSQDQFATCEARNPFSFLGCQEQYQVCKTSALSKPSAAKDDFCTPLTGLYVLTPEVMFANRSQWNGKRLENLNPTQNALYTFLGRLLSSGQLHFQLGFVGLENLVANEYLWDSAFDFAFSAALPSDHWESEVGNWMNVTLATFQRGAATFGRPTEVHVGGGSSSFDFITPPKDPELQKLCRGMKIQSAAHTSYSVMGMALTFLVGFLCILSNWLVPKLVFYFQSRTGRGKYKRLEWNAISAFQLLRMAAEGRGIGPWHGKDREVPTLVEFAHLFKLEGDNFRESHSEQLYRTDAGRKSQYRAVNTEIDFIPRDDIELRNTRDVRDM